MYFENYKLLKSVYIAAKDNTDVSLVYFDSIKWPIVILIRA